MLPVINEGVIYTRVSSNTQVKRGKGLQSQYFSCRRLAEERKIEIINNFEDPGISGKALYRPGLDKLINYLKERSSPTWVIIDDLDRLSRLDIYEYYYLKRQIQGFGGKLLSVNDDLEDESPINQLIENVKVSISQFQRRQNQERVNSRMRARLSSGYWMFHAPVGYLLENKMLTPDPHNAPLIKKLYKDFAAGKYITYKAVKDSQESKCLINPRSGKRYKIKDDTIKKILTNKIYIGEIDFPKWNIRNIQGKHSKIFSQQALYICL